MVGEFLFIGNGESTLYNSGSLNTEDYLCYFIFLFNTIEQFFCVNNHYTIFTTWTFKVFRILYRNFDERVVCVMECDVCHLVRKRHRPRIDDKF